MKVLITGCCGYVGSALVPWLLADRHYVVGYDALWFGDGYLPNDNGHFKLIKGDILDENRLAAAAYKCDAFIHLAGLTSDKACQLNPELSQSVNVASLNGVIRATDNIQRRIYLSSAAIYGGETLYAKAKMECERLLQGSKWVILRPGTVCGYAPRMRFDLPVNQMTRDGMLKGTITVNGGKQVRTNLNIRDLCDALRRLIKAGEFNSYNLNGENLTLLDIAKKVSVQTNAAIRVLDYTDGRSYAMDSHLDTQFTVDQAIQEMVSKFKDGYWKDALTNPTYMNVYDSRNG